MRFVEETGAAWSEAQLKAAEAEIEAQKREWEANRLAALQKEEEMLQRETEEDGADDMLTYSRRDANNQVVNKCKQKEQISTNLSRRQRNCARGLVNHKGVQGEGHAQGQGVLKKAQTTMRKRVLIRRTKFGYRKRKRITSRNKVNHNVEKNDETEEEEEHSEQQDEDSVEKHFTRSATSKEKETPLPNKSKTGVKNQKLLNFARRKQIKNEKNHPLLTTNTQRVLRNNAVRQALKCSKNAANARNNIVNCRNKLRSESCRSSETTKSNSETTDQQTSEETEETDSDKCNGVISTQENTNSTTTYFNVSEEESEDESSSEASDKPPTITKVVGKQNFKNVFSALNESETTPRTRSRGTVNIDLWTLDDSILNSSFHGNVSRSAKKDGNEQHSYASLEGRISITANNSIVDKKSRAYLKRRKTEELNTLDHWVTTKKNVPSNNASYHETQT